VFSYSSLRFPRKSPENLKGFYGKENASNTQGAKVCCVHSPIEIFYQLSCVPKLFAFPQVAVNLSLGKVLKFMKKVLHKKVARAEKRILVKVVLINS
jgi:hypothetical protein